MGSKSRKQARSSAGNSEKREAKKAKGWADVAIRLIDALYDLAQTGNLIGLIVLGLVCWIFLITFRLPEESIEVVLSGIGSFLVGERFYFFLLITALFVSVITNIVQANVYKAHIQDLTEHRKLLVHGLQSGELKPLKNHATSGFDVKTGATNNGSGEI